MFSARIDDELELGLLERHHAEALFELTDANREHLSRWFPWIKDTKSAEDSRSFIEIGLRRFAAGNGLQAGIWYERALVGVIGLLHVNAATKSTEIGYWLTEDCQGQGIVTRACRLLCTYLFEERALQRIEIRCATGNTKSRAIPQRLGFVEEGVLRRAGVAGSGYVDLVVYGMLAEVWQGKKE